LIILFLYGQFFASHKLLSHNAIFFMIIYIAILNPKQFRFSIKKE
jgi:hypothetical protein